MVLLTLKRGTGISLTSRDHGLYIFLYPLLTVRHIIFCKGSNSIFEFRANASQTKNNLQTCITCMFCWNSFLRRIARAPVRLNWETVARLSCFGLQIRGKQSKITCGCVPRYQLARRKNTNTGLRIWWSQAVEQSGGCQSIADLNNTDECSECCLPPPKYSFLYDCGSDFSALVDHLNITRTWQGSTSNCGVQKSKIRIMSMYQTHHHYVPSVVNRSAVMALHRSRSCATLIHSLYDIFVHSLMLSVHIVLNLPRPLLPFILPSISNRCSPSLIICPKYWHFLFFDSN